MKAFRRMLVIKFQLLKLRRIYIITSFGDTMHNRYKEFENNVRIFQEVTKYQKVYMNMGSETLLGGARAF